jgi:hypothetical protein
MQVTHLVPRKPFYRVTELCKRWSMAPTDIAAFVLADELVLSIAVSQLPTETGYYEEVDDDQWCRVPTGRKRFSGTLDLRRDDAWTALIVGSAGVGSFRVPPGDYLEYTGDDDAPLHIEAEQLVVRRSELERFETDQAAAAVAAATAATAIAAGSLPSPAAEANGERHRGPPRKYDVDGFWRHICWIIYDQGLPAKQIEMVRQMREWFEARLGIGNGPDESWIRKKIAPLWRDIQPNSEWSRAASQTPSAPATPGVAATAAKKPGTPARR